MINTILLDGTDQLLHTDTNLILSLSVRSKLKYSKLCVEEENLGHGDSSLESFSMSVYSSQCSICGLQTGHLGKWHLS